MILKKTSSAESEEPVPAAVETKTIKSDDNSEESVDSWWSEDDSTDSQEDDPNRQMEKKIYKNYYLKKFGMRKIKHIPVGRECQVDPENIPLITDILDCPEQYEYEKVMHHDK